MEEQKGGSSAIHGSGGYVDHVIHPTEARFLQLPEGSLPPMSRVPVRGREMILLMEKNWRTQARIGSFSFILLFNRVFSWYIHPRQLYMSDFLHHYIHDSSFDEEWSYDSRVACFYFGGGSAESKRKWETIFKLTYCRNPCIYIYMQLYICCIVLLRLYTRLCIRVRVPFESMYISSRFQCCFDSWSIGAIFETTIIIFPESTIIVNTHEPINRQVI